MTPLAFATRLHTAEVVGGTFLRGRSGSQLDRTAATPLTVIAQRCRARPKAFALSQPGLARHVENRLRKLDSPMTIAVELGRGVWTPQGTVSHETIFRAIYAHGRRGLPAGLSGCLHRRRRRRRHPPLDAAAPTKRGTLGEFNGNGLLRRYVGKRTDPNQFSVGDLRVVANRLNTMPRRVLGWSSPRRLRSRGCTDRLNSPLSAKGA
jgi:IS30 family transposase